MDLSPGSLSGQCPSVCTLLQDCLLIADMVADDLVCLASHGLHTQE